MMQEPAAWREIAERIHRRGLGLNGLCYEITRAADHCSALEPCIIDDRTRARMTARVAFYMDPDRVLMFSGRDCEPGGFTLVEANQVRILAALFLAHDAEDRP